MSAHWDKIVKLACKPKAAAPKAKYLDPIIATTYSDDNSLREVFTALTTRLRDPSSLVVHKALLVIHTMIRTGHTDNVLGSLSSGSDALRLRQIAGGNSGAHFLSENLSSYATYLDSRIRGYRDLKHDVIRVQNENNREDRMSGGDPSERRTGGSSQPSRSRTVVGKKLRQLTVEKGLLRETKGVQKQIDALLQCKFFLDSLDDELTITTLRLLVKDLLILFQAGNEGVINVLEHYFEMSAVDAEESLGIYKSFCVQTEGVVEYLSIARKLSNLLNVPVPNLRHAPTKLAGALEEYLRDPNFEQNRIEYKTNKALADGKLPNKAKPQAASTPASSEISKKAESSSKAEVKQTTPHKQTVDLLESIEESQPTMFNPQTNSPSTSWFHQQQGQVVQLQVQPTGFNPFRQSAMIPQMTGFQPQPFVTAQPTGFPMGSASPFVQPQVTGMPFMVSASPFAQPSASPFAQPSPPLQQPFAQPVPTAMVQPQQTGFLVPQQTGSNPFRQSMMFPDQPRSASATTFQVPPLPTNFNNNTQEPKSQSAFAAALINRPASTPITSGSNAQTLKPVVSHQTGSRNPFGQPKAPSPPPVPKPPTLGQLAFFQPMSTPTLNGVNGINGTGTGSGHNSPLPGQNQQFSSQLAAAIGTPGENPANANMSSVASSFAFGSNSNNVNGSSASTQPPVIPQLTSQTTSTSGLSDAFSSLSFGAFSNATTTNTNTSSVVSAPLQPQATGLAGLKAFKPTSSFGASLMESLPPVAGGAGDSAPTNTIGPQSQANAPSFTVTNFSSTTPSAGGTGALNSQVTGLAPFSSGAGLGGLSNSTSTPNFSLGNTVGVGLRPQMTGGAANPFRASMAGGAASPGGLGGFTGAFGSAQQAPSPSPSGLSPSLTGIGGLGGHGSSLFATAAFKPSLATIPSFTGAFPNASPTPTQLGQPQQQTQPNSLI